MGSMGGVNVTRSEDQVNVTRSEVNVTKSGVTVIEAKASSALFLQVAS